ncbi:methylated-DNA-[protein]-cysteine S-methyltransferase [Rhodobium orientis]|uniref:Methylated-DNA--protein-cysteine methyltransferase n=1 Tax=Rhodobium orientis TaxID=34017 RepID=A0A327JSU8_9HYPH|nr:methylated-DNA--[protein]-cysteine S-methyltransferase [Rhodobium orientis]MBB4304043.1 methylated-DNA-[protein]-cysteine S-methyltransferase [Rhodobium orientis]MBK5950749.1 cysteine methyltransferase [Rhodobium orientis]RAI29579.1 cysteine methyltransferase [Rhodobium orientis]
MNIATLDTPVGRLGVAEEGGRITRLIWDAEAQGERTAVLEESLRQLADYFDGTRTAFDLPLAPAGSAFQQQIYSAMRAIPFGETRSYGDIARDLGVPAQPVGQACGANPIPVIIPCHRVVGTHGLGGFSGAGGVETKIRLLKLEGAYSLLL